MRRRELLALIGAGAANAWTCDARAQQAIPMIGYLSALGEQAARSHIAQLHRGLSENGFVPGRNVAIEYRWANGQYDRLPELAAELVRRPVDVIMAQAPPAALAAKAATSAIPIVFVVGIDPVASGLVASYSRPGGNATGTTLIMAPLGQKRLEIVRELLPRASTVALLHNPASPDAAPEIRDVQEAARVNRLQLEVFSASTPPELATAFGALAAKRPDALLIGGDLFNLVQVQSIVAEVAKLGLAAVYPMREMVEAGGLISYGTNFASSFRQAGIYVSRILKGAKPSDLPVMQPTTFELVINLKTARTLGIEIPASLHARSDEVLE